MVVVERAGGVRHSPEYPSEVTITNLKPNTRMYQSCPNELL